MVVMLLKLLYDLLDIWNHGNLDFAINGIVECHAKVLMNLASTDFHFSRAIVEESFIGALQPIGHLGKGVRTDMADFEIVNVPDDCQLFLFNDLIGDARIIGIDFETNGLEVVTKRW